MPVPALPGLSWRRDAPTGDKLQSCARPVAAIDVAGVDLKSSFAELKNNLRGDEPEVTGRQQQARTAGAHHR
jgi:Asp-tRNA(Asn)/Glu-tRNA(Gln) amidotransferase C subunit